MGSRNAEVAQLVEYLPSKQTVASSSLVFRSIFSATWPSGKAEACKAFTPGSNPGVAFCFLIKWLKFFNILLFFTKPQNDIIILCHFLCNLTILIYAEKFYLPFEIQVFYLLH